MGDEADAWQSRDRCLLECTVPAFEQTHGAGFRAMPSYLAVHKKLISHRSQSQLLKLYRPELAVTHPPSNPARTQNRTILKISLTPNTNTNWSE
eukprot:scaffold105604_cov73-Cyclotella_meneghiniana.AAC.6